MEKCDEDAACCMILFVLKYRQLKKGWDEMKGKKILAVLALTAMVSTQCFTPISAYAMPAEYMGALGGSDVTAVSGTQITVSVTAGTDITKTVNKALEQARDEATDSAPITVTLPKGNYNLTSAMHIYSNTTLDLGGSTLTYVGSERRNMVASGTNGAYMGETNYNSSAKCSGYNGVKNIVVKNGTLKGNPSNEASIVRLSHGTNITLEGLVITGGGCLHQGEVAAIDGFYVKNCTFKDLDKDGTDASNREKMEALQLDIPCSSDIFQNVYEDGTPMKNVEITGCTFSNVPRGVGTHSMLLGAYHENIKINNNTFINVLEDAIVGFGYYNCEIKNNTITNCGAGILFQYFKREDVCDSIHTTIFDGSQKYEGKVKNDAKTEISGNIIQTKYAPTCLETQGIRVEGRLLTGAAKGAEGKNLPTGDYRISGLTVKDNTITTAGFGIHFIGAKDCMITGNTIKGANVSSKDPDKDRYDGMLIESDSESVTVSRNSIENMSRNGIFVQKDSIIAEVTDNQIHKVSEKGINFYDNSGCNAAITGNVMTGCKAGGILVSTKSTVVNIENNQITGMSDKKTMSNGINIYNSSKVKGDITNNTIADANGEGISLSTKSTVTGSVTQNQIKNCVKDGIFIFKSSKVNGDVNANTISDVKLHGIMLNNAAEVKGAINKNKISNAGGKGITVYDTKNKATVKIISDNVIKKAKSHGINITSMKSAVTVSGNKISGGKDTGIMIQPGSKKYAVTVRGNTVKGNNKITGIRAVKGSILVMDNTLSNVAIGVHINKAAKACVYTNKYGAKVKTQLNIAGTNMKNTVKKLAVGSVTSPAKKQIKVSWSKVKDVDGYEIWYSTSADFSKGVKTVLCKAGDTSVVIKKLSGGKTYYVRISSYKIVKDKKIFTGFGKSKTVKVK